MNLSCCIISIGTELTEGRTLNTNAYHLAQKLCKHNITVTRMLTLRDSLTEIEHALKPLLKNKPGKDYEQIIIISGGIGATADDLTLAALSQTLGRKMVVDPNHLRRLKRIQKARQLPDRFLKQATIPQGFTAQTHALGTAPFIYQLEKDPERAVFVLAGVPSQCLTLCSQKVIPLIKKHFSAYKISAPPAQLALKIIGCSENTVEELISHLALPPLDFAYLPSHGELLLLIKQPASSLLSADKHKQILKQARKKIQKALQPTLTYTGATPLIEKLHQQFIAKNWKLALAESCTGGLLSAHFTQLAGASAYFIAGITAYHNHAKQRILQLSPQTLKRYGAVSPQTARALATKLVTAIETPAKPTQRLDLTIGITGVAGPTGGSPTTPVGTVYVCLHLPQHKKTGEYHLQIKGTREHIRSQTVKRTIVLLAKFLHEEASFFT